MANKIDSNIVGASYAEESSLKTLPGTPVWYALEPNSFSDFGGEITNVARNPINASRQVMKGVITDLDASGGYTTDVTSNNIKRLMQGFFFATAREKADSIPLNGTAIAITSVVASTKTYAAASGLGVFGANDLVMFSGFTNSANNGLDVVASSTAATVVGTATKVDEPAPPATARIERVGKQFASGDLALTVGTDYVRLTSLAYTMSDLGLIPGEWIFIGGDTAASKFANSTPGYARVKTVAATYVDLEETTFTPVADTGTGKTIQIFFGKVVKNEDSPSLIVRRSYQIERQLGNDGSGIQSEYITGAIPNEFVLNVPETDKLTADLKFVAVDYETRTGTVGVKAGTRVAALVENAFNTSKDVYRLKMSINPVGSINPAALFAYVTDCSISINNGVSPNKAIGVLGAFDASVGDFAVTGSLTAYFSNVTAVAAVRNNSDVGFNAIFANNNSGFIFDIPLMSLGGGRLAVEKDSPITLPIDMNAAKNTKGYTLLANFFSYLPTIAMPL